MGFFLADAVTEAATARGAPRAPKAPRDLASQPRGCDSCSLKTTWPRLASARMAISGNTKDADILVLGEAPGQEEDQQGKAFVGPSGQLLRKYLPGRAMERLAFQNTVRCHPFGNETPSPADTHACSIHLEEDIAKLPIKAILGVGGSPLLQVYPEANAHKAGIMRIHGVRFPVQIGAQTYWYWPIIAPKRVLETAGRFGGDSFMLPALKADIKRFFKDVDRWGTPTIHKPDPSSVKLPRSIEEARAILAQMADPIGLDLETSCLEPYRIGARLLTAAVSDGEITMAWSIDHPECVTDWGLTLLLEIAASRLWVAHNAAFELAWILFQARKQNLPFRWEPARFEDSMACGRLYHQREALLALDTLSRIVLGSDFKAAVPVNRKNMLAEPLARTLPYNGLDAQACLLIFKKLRPKVDKYTYELILGSIRSTTEMELAGLTADLTVNAELKELWGSHRLQAQESARTIYEVKQFEAANQVEFNIGAPEHVGEALAVYGRVDLPRTAGRGDGRKPGQYSTDDQVLRAKAPEHPLVVATLAYREGQKMESTYIDSVVELVRSSVDGLLHPKYSTMRVSTLRTSSEDPNIQNFPKRKHRELRKQVVAPPGHIFAAFDYKAIEARVIAMVTKARYLCESIIRGEDIHGYWRDFILDLHPDYIERLALMTNETEEKQVLKGGRDIIKTDFVFASFYGATARSVAERTNLPTLIVEQALVQFWQRYPEVRQWIKGVRAAYAETSDITFITGRVRHAIIAGNELINNPIQGIGTGDFVLLAQNALSELAREMDDFYLQPRINIHDDLIFVLPDVPDLLETYIDLIGKELVKPRFDWQIVPLAVEARVGYNWADLDEIASFTGDYVR